jgi:flagellin
MILSVNTNIASLDAQRNLNNSQNSLNKSLERLSSGLRINSAGDDAAGMAISQGLTSQINGMNQAVQNANDGLSMAGTAESALSSYTDMLQRIRELAVESANDTNSSSNRTALNQEAQDLLEEMQRLATTTEFNGTQLLDGTFNDKQLQVGAEANQTISFSIGNLQTSALGQIADVTSDPITQNANAYSNTALAINGTYITDYADYADTVSSVDKSTSAIATAAAINAQTNITGVTATALATTATGLSSLSGHTLQAGEQLTINGVDIFDSGTTYTWANSDNYATLTNAINAQTNLTGVTASVNGSGKLVLTATDGRNIEVTTAGDDGGTPTPVTLAQTLGLSADANLATAVTGGSIELKSNSAIAVNGDAPTAFGLTNKTYALDSSMALNKLSVSTVTGANLAIEQVDAALDQLDQIAANLGATDNRLNYTVSTLQSISENLSSSKSTIVDADFAAETSTMTKYQILQQAGVSVLSQANTSAKTVLTLLQNL